MKNRVTATALNPPSCRFESKTKPYKRTHSAAASRFHLGKHFRSLLETIQTILLRIAWPASAWLLLGLFLAATAQGAPVLRKARLDDLPNLLAYSDLQVLPGVVVIALPGAAAPQGARSARSQTLPLTSSHLHFLTQQGGANPIEVLASRLSSSPATVSFGSVAVGKAATQKVTLQNTGSSTITVTLFTLSASGLGFSTSGFSLPLSISANSSKVFYVNFKPAAQGTLTGTLSISSNASNSPLLISLSGSGSAAGGNTLTSSPASVSFGSLTVGSKATQSIMLNDSGTTSISVSKITASGTGFTVSNPAVPFSIAAGKSVSITATFSPTSAVSYSGQVSVVSTASNSTVNVSLSGSGILAASLSVSPASVSFGSLTVGSKATQSITLTDSGTTSISVSKITASGTGFTVSNPAVPFSIAAGKSVSITATFSPTSAVSYSGQVSVVSTASNSTVNVPLSGSGILASSLSVSPASLDFGSVTVGSKIVLPLILTNAGTTSINVTQIARTGGGFTFSSPRMPFTINAGKNTSLSVTFSPTSTVTYSGLLAISSTASNSLVDVPLSGTGAAAHSVALSWTASSSSGVTGYNVYRGVTSGGPYALLNTSLISGVFYTDYTVTGGITYYYVATAVNSSGQESAYSDQATAVVP